MGRTQIKPYQADDVFIIESELPANYLNKTFKVITENEILLITDYIIVVATVLNETITVTLPSVSKIGYNIINRGYGTVVIQANGSDTINGESFVSISSRYDAIQIIGDTEWIII